MRELRYLMGTPFSGSTVLGAILQTGSAHYVGEVDRLAFFGANQYPLTSEFCLFCAARGRICPLYNPSTIDSLARSRNISDFYSAVSSMTGMETIIDGSKHAGWLRRSFEALSLVERSTVRAIVCVRDPLQFVASHLGAAPEVPAWRAGEIWRDTYIDILRTLFSFSIPFMIVRNEDLQANHAVCVSSARDFFAIPGQTTGPYEISHAHTIGGNTNVQESWATSEWLYVPDRNRSPRFVPPDVVADVLNVPGLFDIANNIFGYGLNGRFS